MSVADCIRGNVLANAATTSLFELINADMFDDTAPKKRSIFVHLDV